MIVNLNLHPQQSLYYWGAVVLNAIKTLPNREIGCFPVYEEVKKSHDISFEMFSLTLDWLFILKAIEIKKGRMKKCF